MHLAKKFAVLIAWLCWISHKRRKLKFLDVWLILLYRVLMFHCYPGEYGTPTEGQINSPSASDAGCGASMSPGNTEESSKSGTLRNNCHASARHCCEELFIACERTSLICFRCIIDWYY